MMLALAAEYPEYATSAKACRIVETASADFYGKGYQDVQNRLPKISGTVNELGWTPKVDMETSLRRIFESYRQKVVEARALVDQAE